MPLPRMLPLPETEVVNRTVAAAWDQSALTLWSPVICTEQDSCVPLQAPPQPVNTSPTSGCSNTVSVEPSSTSQLQSVPAGAEPQWISDPLLCSQPSTMPFPPASGSL